MCFIGVYPAQCHCGADASLSLCVIISYLVSHRQARVPADGRAVSFNCGVSKPNGLTEQTTARCSPACKPCPPGKSVSITDRHCSTTRADLRFFNHPTGNRLGLYAATFYLPSIPSAFLGDYLANRFGRRIPILVGCFIVVVGSFLNSLANGIPMWLVGESTVPSLSSPADCRPWNYWIRRGDGQSRRAGFDPGTCASPLEAHAGSV